VLQPNGSISYQSDYLVPPNAYNLLGAEIGTQIEWHHKNILITATANNILNTKYREYLNAFRYFCDEMGSNYSIKLKIPF
jgi:iron complex outermembrane receptor protein